MGAFLRRGIDTVVVLDEYEAQLLPTLLGELTDLLGGDDSGPDEVESTESDDPFAVWEKSFSREPSLDDADFLDPDPITRRLFPDAYVDDPAASHDFRRFTHDDQRAAKVAAIATVLDDLEGLTPSGRVRIPADHLEAWMTSLNNLRLVLSVVLGITDETSASEAAERPDDDPRSVIHQYYLWLGMMLESLMSAIMHES